MGYKLFMFQRSSSEALLLSRCILLKIKIKTQIFWFRRFLRSGNFFDDADTFFNIWGALFIFDDSFYQDQYHSFKIKATFIKINFLITLFYLFSWHFFVIAELTFIFAAGSTFYFRLRYNLNPSPFKKIKKTTHSRTPTQLFTQSISTPSTTSTPH